MEIAASLSLPLPLHPTPHPSSLALKRLFRDCESVRPLSFFFILFHLHFLLFIPWQIPYRFQFRSGAAFAFAIESIDDEAYVHPAQV